MVRPSMTSYLADRSANVAVMAHARPPFRFIAAMPTLDQPAATWRDAVRRLEDTGYSTVAISDHVTRGWAMDPLVTMSAAAGATDRLRVLSLVLSNDFRHPALVYKAIATIDVLSGGRAELGLGAGWLTADYDALGVPFDPPAVRVQRLGESVRLIKRMFLSDAEVSFVGSHYQIRDFEPLPRPIQRPGPPLLIGGGGKAILTLAGRQADIVGINASLAPDADRAAAVIGLTEVEVEEKLRWVREAAVAAGRAPADLEFQLNVLELHITDSRAEANAVLDSLSTALKLPREMIESAPAVLVGGLARCSELLEERRARFGFSYIKLGSDPLASARLVAHLAGR